jgi:hypothetical protein
MLSLGVCTFGVCTVNLGACVKGSGIVEDDVLLLTGRGTDRSEVVGAMSWEVATFGVAILT